MAKRVAEFLKVSFEQFAEGYRDSFGECDEKLIREVYDSLKLPRRATRGSAGYDFFVIIICRTMKGIFLQRSRMTAKKERA